MLTQTLRMKQKMMQWISRLRRYPTRWQATRLKIKTDQKRKAIYSQLEKEKMKRLAALFKSNHLIK